MFLKCSIPHKFVGLISGIGPLRPYIPFRPLRPLPASQTYFCRLTFAHLNCHPPNRLTNRESLDKLEERSLPATHGRVVIWGMVDDRFVPQSHAKRIARCEPWCWNICLHNWAIFGVNVDNYSSTMEHLGSTCSGDHICRITKDIPSLCDVSPSVGGNGIWEMLKGH